MKCLAILVDALNPVYLDYMPALRGFVARAASGRLREPLGFTPREAYFGGLTPNETGYTHMFRPHAGADFNPFSLSAHFPERWRPELDKIQAYAQPSFAALYARSQNIPWRLLKHFAVSERFSPWDPRKGYRSIFDELRKHGRKWAYIGWPFHQEPDAALAERGRQAVEQGADFVFVHLSELDGVGHEHGPHAAETMETARRTDSHIAALLDVSEGRNALVFGDHGMVPVGRHIAVSLDGLPDDPLYFIDSTSVRVWGTPHAREAAREILRQREGLFEMDHDRLREYDAERVCNGLLFWAEPGVVLTPNFFGPKPVRGMHGYLPDVFDNESTFAFVGASDKVRSLGTIEARRIHGILRGLLGLASFPELTEVRSPVYSLSPDGDGVVRRALAGVVATVAKKLPQITSLHLCGGFGRGEGTVIAGRLVNDLDLVFGHAAPIPSEHLRATADEVRRDLDLPFVDLAYMLAEDVSQYAYDFKYGTQTLLGSRATIESRPHLASADIPRAAFVRLVLNRVGGYHSSFVPPYASMEGYLTLQIVKLGLGVAQWLLAERQAYHYSYQVCWRRLDLLPSALRPPLGRCFEAKLLGGKLPPDATEEVVAAVRSCLAHCRDLTATDAGFSLRKWRESRVYTRLLRDFLAGRTASSRDIAAWFQIIHPQ